jgi:hypothetical protein
MKVENQPEFGNIKAAILNATFTPISQHSLDPSAYPTGAVCAQLPKPFDQRLLLRIMDLYTPGNNGAIVSSDGRDDRPQWLIMQPDMAQQLKVNLRTGSRKKFTDANEMKEMLGR